MDFLLRFFVKRIINKYQPKVIGIFGDEEKDITKHAVFSILFSKFKSEVRKSQDNPEASPSVVGLTVLGLDLGASWSQVLFRGLGLWLFGGKYPKYLVVAYPVNAPGKIETFIKLLKPRIAIIGEINDRNVEYFTSLQQEIEEKGKIASSLDQDDLLILGVDSKNVVSIKKKAHCNVLGYGFLDGAQIQAKEFTIWQNKDADVETDEKLLGVAFKLVYQGSTVPFALPGVFGADHVRAVLASIPIAMSADMNLMQISEFFRRDYQPSRGRLNLVKGIKHTMILDDSYDATPYSMDLALETLGLLKVQAPRERFAILGSMNSLGGRSEGEHREIGRKVEEVKIDYLVSVGERARDIMRGAREAGMPEDRCYYFGTPEEAGKFIQNRLEKGDLMLVCGGYEMRMEKIVKELMSEPMRAEMILAKKE